MASRIPIHKSGLRIRGSGSEKNDSDPEHYWFYLSIILRGMFRYRYLNGLEVGDELELGERGEVELRRVGEELMQPLVQRLLEQQNLPVTRVLHQPLNKISHLKRKKTCLWS